MLTTLLAKKCHDLGHTEFGLEPSFYAISTSVGSVFCVYRPVLHRRRELSVKVDL